MADIPLLGFLILLMGGIAFALVWAILRFIPRMRGIQPTFSVPNAKTKRSLEEQATSQNGVIIVQRGGRIDYVNGVAREWFNLLEGETPNLEILASRIRPASEFLKLCASEYKGRFSLNGQPLECASYWIPGLVPSLLITMNRIEMRLGGAGGEGASSALKILSDFNHSVSTQIELQPTIRAILESLERLVPVDVLELKLWHPEQQKLTPYRLVSGPRSTHRLEKSLFQPPTGYSALLVEKRRPIYLPDTAEARDETLRQLAEQTGFRSYIGLPLMVGKLFVGTLEVALTGADAYSREDFEVLQLISVPAAVALRNAILFDQQKHHAKEVSGLNDLARLLGELNDPDELFPRLVKNIAPLFDVQMLGFLLYNEGRRVLEAQVPFLGMPAQALNFYRVPVPVGSLLEERFLNQEILITQNAMEDETWRQLGFQDYSRAASLRDSALVPLVTAGRLLGYFQIANHLHPEDAFSAEEMRLLNIVAGQAASIIDNVLLMQQTRQRTQRLETLRRIASLATSSATLDEFLRYTVQELGRLLNADVGIAALLDEARGILRPHEPSLFGLSGDLLPEVKALLQDDVRFPQTVTVAHRPLLFGDIETDSLTPAIYKSLARALDVHSLMAIPLIVRDRSMGEFILAAKNSEHFSPADLQVVSTAAGQAASLMEKAALSGQTDEILRRRIDQLTALTRISRELNTTMDWNYLLKVVYDEAVRTTRADCGTLLLFDINAPSSYKVAFYLGDTPSSSLLPIEQKAIESGEAILVTDYSNSEYQPSHDGVRSALVVPIAYQQSKAGLIHLHSYVPERFDQTSVEIIQVLAIQAAIALGNAQRYQEQVQRNELLSRRAQILSKLLETTSALMADLPLEQALEALAYGIQEATPFQAVLMSIVDPEAMMQRRVAGVGMPLETLQLLKSHQQPWASVAQLLKPEFKVGQGYFIPYNKRPLISGDLQIVKVVETSPGTSQDAWHQEDVLLYPVTDTEGNPIGLVSLDAPRDGKRPNRLTLETIEIFVTQAALIIQSKQRITAYQAQVERLSTSLERQQQLLAFSQSHLPTLLHKDLEQMVAIRQLERRARRIRAGLEITETVNRQIDANSMLIALGREALTRLDMSASFVAENTLEGPRLLQAFGNIPRGVNVDALFGQRNPLRHSLQTGETLLVPNLDQDETWRETSLLSSLRAKSFVCLPIFLNEKPVAGVLAVSTAPLPPLTEEDRQIYSQISRQVSITLQEISLLTEMRRRLREVNILLDFSNELSNLDTEGILSALLENALKVVTNAHAGVVLLFNPAAGLLIPRAAQGYADVDSMMQITYLPGESLPGQVFLARKPRRVDELSFARDYTLPADFLIRYREATAGRLPVSSILIPIQTGDNLLGVMVLDNFNTPAAFTKDDEVLLMSLCQQVALSLENLRLMQASQERTEQLQALTFASSKMAATLKSDELTGQLLDHLAQLLPFDTAILWLREGDQMTVAAARGFPDNEERLGLSVSIEDSLLLAEMNRTSEAIVVGDIRRDPRFPTLVEPDRLSWLGVPMVSKGEVIGVIALEKKEPNFYSFELTQLVSTFASQAAVALENAKLYEESVRRAAELDERSRRLALLNTLSSELSGSLDESQILYLTARELQKALSAFKVSIVTLDRLGNPILSTVTPVNLAIPQQPLPPAPVFNRLKESLGIFSTDDVQREPDLQPLLDYLADTTSLLILPLVAGTTLRALAFLHLPPGYRSSPAEIELGRTICNQAAIALESARLYHATLTRAEQLAIINRASYEIGLSLDPEEIYQALHRAASQLMTVESFVISLLDEEHDEIEGVYLLDPNGRSPKMRIPRTEGLSGRVIQSGQPLLIPDASLVETGGRNFGDTVPRSILAVPITLGGRTIGMLSVQSYRPNVYTEDDQQILSTLANQAAVAIQNARLLAETRRLAEELEQRVIERTAELAREQRNTETLLRILTEAASTLDLDRALNRTLALLNDAIGAEQGSILLVDEKDNTLHYRAGYGYVTPVMTEGSRPTPLKIGEGLAGWVIQNRQSVCIEDLTKDPRWKKIPLSRDSHRSAIAAPLIVGEDVIGVIMVFHRQIGYFSQEHVNLVQAIGSQVSVAINNAKLYELIRDQAERLGAMVRAEQVETSRRQAILEAVADGVLVTDPLNRINFINLSAERILKLKANAILGQSLEKFAGLFGRAAQTWMTTIRSWSEVPESYQVGETYAEQLTLEDGRVVLVHLSPVIWQNEFLGTVSIFRDITHEVEVDRLKSEFVATVSHELRTPMTSIKGYVDILLMGAAGALNETQTHFLEIVRSNTDRLSVLVNDLLDISRIESGRVTLSLQPVDLREVADEVVAEILSRSQKESKPMAIVVDAPPDLPPIHGDPERVRQILTNLVDNAYNYTPANGQIQIEMMLNEDNMVRVDVKDNGIGIQPDELDRVFERFYRGEHAFVLATPGTGLGLAIVKQLVLMHKGKIWVESAGIPGQGSTFSFTLPVYQDQE
jgi:PAS domain S-box-containing protein